MLYLTVLAVFIAFYFVFFILLKSVFQDRTVVYYLSGLATIAVAACSKSLLSDTEI